MPVSPLQRRTRESDTDGGAPSTTVALTEAPPEEPMPEALPDVLTAPTHGGAMADTGERMVPETSGVATFWEHIYRYRFATRFVPGRRVLDIACGEGYGSAALLRAGAASVIGVDISEETCDHARGKYGIDARVGSAECIPLPNGSIDTVVSFETIEHVERPDAFLDECVRVLTPHGTLVLSTPNREAFAELGNENPFHCSEMTEEEFLALLAPRFEWWELYTQRPRSAAWWSAGSLAAERSPWLGGRGFGRVRSLFAPLCAEFRGQVDAELRQRAVDLVLTREDRLVAPLNPYVIRRRSTRGGERPYYFVAVARV
jgi:SAM-dependent methyltransferase